MSDEEIIAIFAQNAAEQGYLSALVRAAGFRPVPVNLSNAEKAHILLAIGAGYPESEKYVVQLGGAAPDGDVRVLDLPVRAGNVISLLQKKIQDRAAWPVKIDIAGAQLDTRENLWLCAGRDAQRLTEKETAILAYLKSAGGAVTREELLHHVWAYAHDVETHTLETHIYRLRQKIEIDPSNPKILLTQEDGYSIASAAAP